MTALALIIAIIALIIAIMAYQRAGGQIEVGPQLEGLSKAIDTFREKTADLLERIEAALRKKEEERKES
ncbi:MAG: hypothetical protein DRG33_05275 [Deltaproteobacteria bacterium]|nr:MAG: hypothetical protein DRG33_05275 [Deltaproteobacteria bacterium]